MLLITRLRLDATPTQVLLSQVLALPPPARERLRPLGSRGRRHLKGLTEEERRERRREYMRRYMAARYRKQREAAKTAEADAGAE